LLGYDAGADAPAPAAPSATAAKSSSGRAAAPELQAAPHAIEALAYDVDITAIEPVEQMGWVRTLTPPFVIGRPLRILVADDSADNRLLIQAFLKHTACLVEQAENGEIALGKFVSGNYDVVLMDIQMPVMDGYTAAKLIRQWERNHNASRTPIIALTASVLDEAVHKSFDAGCDTHVSKPVRRPTLLAAIRDVTAKSQSEGQPVPEMVAEESQARASEFINPPARACQSAATAPLRSNRIVRMG
jgi:CheY-like chemotaxis protein